MRKTFSYLMGCCCLLTVFLSCHKKEYDWRNNTVYFSELTDKDWSLETILKSATKNGGPDVNGASRSKASPGFNLRFNSNGILNVSDSMQKLTSLKIESSWRGSKFDGTEGYEPFRYLMLGDQLWKVVRYYWESAISKESIIIQREFIQNDGPQKNSIFYELTFSRQ